MWRKGTHIACLLLHNFRYLSVCQFPGRKYKQTMKQQQAKEIEAVSLEVKEYFRPLTAEQLNWKPAPEKWSIAQCLDHLIRTNEGYLEQFKRIARGEQQHSLWERMPFLPTLFGNYLLKATAPVVQTPMKAPKGFRPTQSGLQADIIDRFLAHNEEAIKSIEQLPDEGLEHYILTSPASALLTLRLDQAVEIIAQHERRHLLQAIRVMESEDFPKP